MRPALEALAIVALAYFVVLNGLYLLFTAIAWRGITEHRRERAYSATAEAFSSPLTPPNLDPPACVQRGGGHRRERAVTARSALSRIRGGRRERRVERRNDRPASNGIRSGTRTQGAPGGDSDCTGARVVLIPPPSRAHGRRQGERRQSGRAQLRRQRGTVSVRVRDRRGRHARGRRADSRGEADPRRSTSRCGHRRHRPNRKRLRHRARSRDEGGSPPREARDDAGGRILSRLSRRAGRLEPDPLSADHLRGVRSLPPLSRGSRGWLGDRHGRRRRRARCPPPPLPA
jgi:hypothetical protein